MWVHAQLCLTLWDPMDCSLQGSSVHEIFQATIQDWAAIPYSRGSSPRGDGTHISLCLQILYHWHHLGSPGNAVDYINWFFKILNQLFVFLGKTSLGYSTLFFLIYYWNQLTLLRTFAFLCLKNTDLYSHTLRFLYQSNASFMSWKVSLLLCFLENFVWNWCYFFFKCSIEFSSKTI